MGRPYDPEDPRSGEETSFWDKVSEAQMKSPGWRLTWHFQHIYVRKVGPDGNDLGPPLWSALSVESGEITPSDWKALSLLRMIGCPLVRLALKNNKRLRRKFPGLNVELL